MRTKISVTVGALALAVGLSSSVLARHIEPAAATEHGRFLGALEPGGALAGALESGGALAGALELGGALAGALESSGALAGALEPGGALAGALEPGGALAGALESSGALAGALEPGGVLAGALEPGGALAGALESGGALAGALELGGALAGALESGGALAGALEPGGALAGALEPGGALAGALEPGGALAGALESGGALAGALEPGGALAGALESGGALAGALEPGGALAGALEPGGALAGALEPGGALAGALESDALDDAQESGGALAGAQESDALDDAQESGALASENTVAELVRQAGISVAANSFGIVAQIGVTSVTGNAVAGKVAGEAVKTTVGEVLDVEGQKIGDAIGRSLHAWRLDVAAQSELAERNREWNELKDSLLSSAPDQRSESVASMAPMPEKEIEVEEASESTVVEEANELEHTAMAPPMALMSGKEVEEVGEREVVGGEWKNVEYTPISPDVQCEVVLRLPKECVFEVVWPSLKECVDAVLLRNAKRLRDEFDAPDGDVGVRHGDYVIGYQPYYTESGPGVVNNGKGFWKNYLPEGPTAKFEIGSQGSVVVNAMTDEKQHIGYMGDMPAIASTFRNIKERGGTDFRIVAVLGTSNFRAGKLDAAAIWEPTASKIVKAGIARRAASGEDFDALDGGFMVMLNDLVSQRPDVHRGWLEAELDAQLFMLDPANADDVASMAEAQTEQIDQDVLKHSLFGAWPAEQGGGDVKVQLDFIVTERVQGLLDNATAFLYSPPTKPVAAVTIRDGGVVDEVARAILKDRGLSSPLGVIKAQGM